MSQIDRSKASEEIANTASAHPMSKRSLTSKHVLAAPRCVIATPLGAPVKRSRMSVVIVGITFRAIVRVVGDAVQEPRLPVEPDVKIM